MRWREPSVKDLLLGSAGGTASLEGFPFGLSLSGVEAGPRGGYIGWRGGATCNGGLSKWASALLWLSGRVRARASGGGACREASSSLVGWSAEGGGTVSGLAAEVSEAGSFASAGSPA